MSKNGFRQFGPLFKSTVRVKSFLDDIYARPCPSAPPGVCRGTVGTGEDHWRQFSGPEYLLFPKPFRWLLAHGSPTLSLSSSHPKPVPSTWLQFSGLHSQQISGGLELWDFLLSVRLTACMFTLTNGNCASTSARHGPTFLLNVF